ncbi:MAG: hypothetical protein E2O39_02715 [Planctomycetota bacterium]|nr:MAG: hypothetical protein E2O39_02715 [Planctomycetota bacterium]
MSVGAVSFSSTWAAMGVAVLHFLWQGALIGLFAGLLLGTMRQRSSAERYAVASGAMLLCLLAFLASFTIALADISLATRASALQNSLATREFGAGLLMHSGTTGIAATCWAVGALWMAVRFSLQCYGAQRLKTTAVLEPDSTWQRAFHTLKEELGVSRNVRFLRSGLAQVPMVVGWFSPVVLVPASAFTGLTPDQLRSILAHELAHIRRHDHLLNAAQAVVEIVLFFHPVVWWISKQMRLEREYCCDDSSVRLTGDPRLLAEALTTMETLRISKPMTRTVLAANGGPLMQRITRILGARLDGRTPLASWQLPAGFVLAGLLAVAGSAYAAPTLVFDGEAIQQDRASDALRVVKAELQAMVEAGKITEQQAQERIAGYKKHQAEKQAAGKKTPGHRTDRANAKEVWAKLQTGVEAGKLTHEQARERFAAWQRKSAEQETVRLDRALIELEAAVAAGRITEAQAKERIAEIKKGMASRKVASDRADPEAVIREIAAAVEAGRLTPEQGKARIEAFKESLKAKQAGREPNVKGVALRIEAAVAAGRITPEQGEARLEAFKKSLAEKKAAHKQKEYGGDIEAIKRAVKAGELTPEQAAKKIEALKKRSAGKTPEQHKQDPVKKRDK